MEDAANTTQKNGTGAGGQSQDLFEVLNQDDNVQGSSGNVDGNGGGIEEGGDEPQTDEPQKDESSEVVSVEPEAQHEEIIDESASGNKFWNMLKNGFKKFFGLPESEKRTWKDYVRVGLSSFVGLVSIAAVGVLFAVPGAQALLLAPFVAMGVAAAPALAATAVQFGSMALTALGIGRDVVKFKDVLLAPVRLVASVVKFAADIVLSIFSPILPNKWLANSYAFLNKVMNKINGVESKEVVAEDKEVVAEDKHEVSNEQQPLLSDNEQKLSTGRKVLNFFKNTAFAILTPIAKTAIFVGNFAFNLLLIPVKMIFAPLIPRNWVKSIDEGIGEVNNKFNAGMDAMSNSQMNAPVVGTKVYSIETRIKNAVERVEEHGNVSRENDESAFVNTNRVNGELC